MQKKPINKELFSRFTRGFVCSLMLLLSSCAQDAAPPSNAVMSETVTVAHFVGSTQCSSCHAEQSAAWQGSHHQLAMQHANRTAVLAPFAGESLTHHGVTSTFSARAEQFVIRTEGPDGKLADFTVKYTFGLAPLQQYLLELPGGRLQSFTLAWDTRPKAVGGQRWFDLYPQQDYPSSDPMHWSGYQQNWNFMCADCHSTNLRKNYDQDSDSFNTTWSEISVGCEACHGPGSRHLQWAARNQPTTVSNKGLLLSLNERKNVAWPRNAKTGQPQRSEPRTTSREIDICGRCHSRRAQLTDTVTAADPLAQGFQVALLDEGLYYPDGQMRDEVYNHGSFLQSRMHTAGVTCSDCHDPHSQKLRAPGDATCAQCHNAGTYATNQHHFHPEKSQGARCASCHMPTHTYMGVDQRHDHSFRIPQPAASAKIGAPDACTSCHKDRDSNWAQATIVRHYPHPKQGFQTFGNAFAALERGSADAAPQVLGIARDPQQPAIVRASALRRLARTGAAVDPSLLSASLRDPNELVRAAAAEAAAGQADLLQPLLNDALRSVRLNAFQGMQPQAGEWQNVNAEFIAVQKFNADRPEARANLGNTLFDQQDIMGAQAAFQSAIKLDPGFSMAYLNLADSFRALGDEANAEQTLREALQKGREDIATVQFALGLSLVRQGKYQAALTALAEANRREPDNSQFTYTYAVALHDRGNKQAALNLLEAAIARRPNQRQLAELLDIYRRGL
jgi:tetratricopeptide (TPR) repeat protein